MQTSMHNIKQIDGKDISKILLLLLLDLQSAK
jgi:hypothetical protein